MPKRILQMQDERSIHDLFNKYIFLEERHAY